MGAQGCARVLLRGARVLGCLAAVALGGEAAVVSQGAAAPVRVVMETELGNIELEIDTVHAPVTAANFLKYVDAGLYARGRFHRTVRPDNQVTKPVRIAVIQGAADEMRANEFFPPIPLERTSVTGLRHVDGALSMARSAPDSGTHEFFVCIGDQPALDFGGARNADGQGFAVFGRVVSGMEVVRRIQMSPAQGERLSPPIAIRQAVRAR